MLPEDEALEFKRLEAIATQKRIAYQKVDFELIVENCQEVELVGEFIEAKKELTDAVNEYNAYKVRLASIYDLP
ncbi:MAG TPA: hypothetical protein VGB63_11965 [Pedobacter sp.]|jgi:hypothetical protein